MKDFGTYNLVKASNRGFGTLHEPQLITSEEFWHRTGLCCLIIWSFLLCREGGAECGEVIGPCSARWSFGPPGI
jgi:hypothetical protein